MPLWYQGQSVLQYWNGVTLKLAMSEGLQLNFYAAMTAMSWWERTVSHHYVPSRTQEGPLEMDFLSKHVKAQLGPPLNEEKFLFVCVSRNMINWPLPVKNVGTWSLQARLAGSHGFYVQQGFFWWIDHSKPLKPNFDRSIHQKTLQMFILNIFADILPIVCGVPKWPWASLPAWQMTMDRIINLCNAAFMRKLYQLNYKIQDL